MQVTVLNKFEISYKGFILNVDAIHSNMIELLLVYMLTHRNKEIPSSELAEALWSDDESDNPLGALKNLMYRLRKLLKDTFKEENIIITGRGSYTFNPAIKVAMDVELFEKHLKASKTSTSKTDDLIEALNLYQGSFLPKQIKYHWILQQSVYYQSLYNSNVKVLIELLKKNKYYDEMESWCIKALKYDSLDEGLHSYFIFALIKQGKDNIAKEHYVAIKQRLYDELGVEPSASLQELYQTILRKDNDRQLDLVVIQQDLKEQGIPNVAFYCDYNVFKEIYRLEARQLNRLGIAIHCCLITCDVTLSIPETSKMYETITKKMMETLKLILEKSLRAGDVISRYSKSQMVTLLPTCSYESTQIIMKRVQEEFAKVDISKQGKLSFDFKEIILEE